MPCPVVCPMQFPKTAHMHAHPPHLCHARPWHHCHTRPPHLFAPARCPSLTKAPLGSPQRTRTVPLPLPACDETPEPDEFGLERKHSMPQMQICLQSCRQQANFLLPRHMLAVNDVQIRNSVVENCDISSVHRYTRRIEKICGYAARIS
jgi:hypothetical protein